MKPDISPSMTPVTAALQLNSSITSRIIIPMARKDPVNRKLHTAAPEIKHEHEVKIA